MNAQSKPICSFLIAINPLDTVGITYKISKTPLKRSALGRLRLAQGLNGGIGRRIITEHAVDMVKYLEKPEGQHPVLASPIFE
jgi:hypothetical protein